jgi:hypothetical protein
LEKVKLNSNEDDLLFKVKSSKKKKAKIDAGRTRKEKRVTTGASL